MKYQKLFVFFLSFLICFLLYFFFFDDSKYYLSLGDNFAVGINPFDEKGKGYSDYLSDYLRNKKELKYYNNYFSEINYRTTDIIKDIKLNREKIIQNKKITINESIAKADIITISIGFNDLFYKTKYNKKNMKFDIKTKEYIDEIICDINKLIELIRKINNTPIYFIGYFNPHNLEDGITDKMIHYFEIELKKLKLKELYYIDIKPGFKNKFYYLPNIKNSMPSLEGYNYISNEIIKIIEENN